MTVNCDVNRRNKGHLNPLLKKNMYIQKGSKFVTDTQTNSLTPYGGYEDFLFQFNLLPPYSLRLQGIIFTNSKRLKGQ